MFSDLDLTPQPAAPWLSNARTWAADALSPVTDTIVSGMRYVLEDPFGALVAFVANDWGSPALPALDASVLTALGPIPIWTILPACLAVLVLALAICALPWTRASLTQTRAAGRQDLALWSFIIFAVAVAVCMAQMFVAVANGLVSL